MNVRLFGFLLQIYKTYSGFHDVAFGSIFHVTGRSSELSGFWTCKRYCNGTCFTWSVQRSLVHTNSYAGKGEIQFFLSCSKNRKLKCYWNFVIPTYPLEKEKEKHLVRTFQKRKTLGCNKYTIQCAWAIHKATKWIWHFVIPTNSLTRAT